MMGIVITTMKTMMQIVMTAPFPDGVYNVDTGYHFCCREDGHVSTPVHFPTGAPFTLFPSGGNHFLSWYWSRGDLTGTIEDWLSEWDPQCQTVDGMVATLGWIFFDDENSDTVNAHSGSLPFGNYCSREEQGNCQHTRPAYQNTL